MYSVYKLDRLLIYNEHIIFIIKLFDSTLHYNYSHLKVNHNYIKIVLHKSTSKFANNLWYCEAQ